MIMLLPSMKRWMLVMLLRGDVDVVPFAVEADAQLAEHVGITPRWS
jgi:hypothetical protein